MAFRKVPQILRYTLERKIRIGFVKSIHRSIQSPEMMMMKNPNTDLAAFKYPLRRIHMNLNQPELATEEQRRGLPEELLRNVVVLTCHSTAEGGKCDVYLVGTCHVLEESCKQVEAIVRHLKPEIVFLELCKRRSAALSRRTVKVPTMDEIIDLLKKKNHSLFEIVSGYLYAKIGEELGVVPGSEFRIAYEEANKYGGKVIFGDRPIDITLKRGWGRMSIWDKTKGICCLFFQGWNSSKVKHPKQDDDLKKIIEQMFNDEVNALQFQEMRKAFPTLVNAIIDERDKYMSSTLLNVASKHSLVVAVVGKGHLSGIKEHWKKPIVIEELLEVP